MKSQIVRKILFLILLVILYDVQVFGQGVSSSNPIEYTAIGEGEALLSKQIKQQQHCLDTLFVLQGGIVYSQTKMKNWEQKYNSYLLAELKKRLKISIFLWRKSCASH